MGAKLCPLLVISHRDTNQNFKKAINIFIHVDEYNIFEFERNSVTRATYCFRILLFCSFLRS